MDNKKFRKLMETFKYIIDKGDRANYIMIATADDDVDMRVNIYGNEYMMLGCFLYHVKRMISMGNMKQEETLSLIHAILLEEGEDDD